MRTIILYGSEEDGRAGAILSALLRAAERPFLWSRQNRLSAFFPDRREPALLLAETDDLERVPAEYADFMIMKEKQAAPSERIPWNAPCALACSSAEENVRGLIQGVTQPVLTCGMRSSDTLTYASLLEVTAVISIQRGFAGADGRMIEPQDVPLAYSPGGAGRYELLAAAAALLYVGEEKCLTGAEAF